MNTLGNLQGFKSPVDTLYSPNHFLWKYGVLSRCLWHSYSTSWVDLKLDIAFVGSMDASSKVHTWWTCTWCIIKYFQLRRFTHSFRTWSETLLEHNYSASHVINKQPNLSINRPYHELFLEKQFSNSVDITVRNLVEVMICGGYMSWPCCSICIHCRP